MPTPPTESEPVRRSRGGAWLTLLLGVVLLLLVFTSAPELGESWSHAMLSRAPLSVVALLLVVAAVATLRWTPTSPPAPQRTLSDASTQL
ncbi:MAG: hypothetical protein IPH07_22120 [Deltaproteobacteria bacterium]|nr:hypothetical protein [Deltaproteobacteria bacterium]MBK8239596.1 hypothetical protein [Deltaproteobacteria bacterium]MBK8714331.1 hypothetical protein [Deltaproteobacteria bacterium]MBP7285881.1 hypothetical protein [Nannocystaceae bacterium]